MLPATKSLQSYNIYAREVSEALYTLPSSQSTLILGFHCLERTDVYGWLVQVEQLSKDDRSIPVSFSPPESGGALASFPGLPLLAKIKRKKVRERKAWENLSREEPHAFCRRGRNIDDVVQIVKVPTRCFTHVLPVLLLLLFCYS